jgi:succinate dehydrogenase hydrophobic anchor subunit
LFLFLCFYFCIWFLDSFAQTKKQKKKSFRTFIEIVSNSLLRFAFSFVLLIKMFHFNGTKKKGIITFECRESRIAPFEVFKILKNSIRRQSKIFSNAFCFVFHFSVFWCTHAHLFTTMSFILDEI